MMKAHYLVTFGGKNYAPSGQVVVLEAESAFIAVNRALTAAVRCFLRKGKAHYDRSVASRAGWWNEGKIPPSCMEHLATDDISSCSKCGFDTWQLKNQASHIERLYVESVVPFVQGEYLSWDCPDC